MRIFDAEPEDIPILAHKCRLFASTLPYKRNYSPGCWSIINILSNLASEHVLLVAKDDAGQICGMIGGQYAPHHWRPEYNLLIEHFWWVDPKSRGQGAGSALLSAFVERGQGCHAVRVSLEKDSEVSDEFMAKYGLILCEKNYIKEN